MTEYKIKIKMYQQPALSSYEQLDEFLERWIEKIEELGLQFGGGFDHEVGILDGVVQFGRRRAKTIEKNLYEIQTWLGKQPSKPVILHLLLLGLDD